VGVWPIFVWWAMYGDDPVALKVGDEISWNVRMIDGHAQGWPTELLISTTVRIEEPPPGAHHGAIAATPQLSAVWAGKAPIGSRFEIHAALDADWLNPPFKTTVTGPITRLHIAWTPAKLLDTPGAPMRLIETHEITRTLHQPHDPEQAVAGLVAEVDVRTNEIAPFATSR
jgi:hypothetical protein